MNKATEVIVYRNPMEKEMWDFWMENPVGLAIVQGLIFLFFVAVLCFIGYVAWGILKPKRNKNF